MRTYTLTDAQFRSLARGGGDPDAIALLVDSQLSRRRLYLMAAAEQDSGLLEILRLVARIDRAVPAAGRDLLRHPFLDTWFARPAAERASCLGALAAATAVTAGLPFTLEVYSHDEDLVLPALGTALGVGPGPVVLSGDGKTLTITPEHGWRPAPRLRVTGTTIEIMDADPLRDRFPDPPLPPLRPVLVRAFGRVIEQAWDLLDEEQASAMGLAVRAVVPLRAPADGTQVSASVRGCFGAIGMSLPGDPTTAAELLIHEFQHEKLGALLDLVKLAAEGGPAHFHAPWRPDPRPAAALMQGVYAFAGVAAFWRGHRHHLDGGARDQAEFRYAYWREQSRYGLAQLLGSSELTPLGARFFGTLRETLESWPEDSPAAGAARRRATTIHIAWRLAHYEPDPEDVAALAQAWTRRDPAPREVAAPRITADPAPGLTALVDDVRPDPPPGDWITLAVALHTRHPIAYHRPDLLKAVHVRTGRPDLEALARFLSTAVRQIENGAMSWSTR
ncbi:aKG-HExxH-type peptide beta-hydroxylase [Actinoplanes sp. NPDC051494]|uniref:aKG-HExxH-type peptide beta-hydroxylase n=1 Tax=Actinoplanes sp. NPDC051494 TaxID=3363907 RepID=UPI00378ED930